MESSLLPFSKYTKPVFGQGKPNGKLGLIVDLREIISLIADDYTNNNHPDSTLPDAAQHLAGKSLFCKLDCSQVYHCSQMVDQRSVELLAFNFASRSFAYKRLAQGFSRSLSAFSSSMRKCLDPVVKADQCAQYVDNIGIAANKAHPEHSGSLQVYSPGRSETNNWEMPLWSQTSLTPRKNYFTRRNLTTSPNISRVPRQT